MGSTERIQTVAKRIAKWHKNGYQIVAVPSAMSGETSRLITLAKTLQDTPDPEALDALMATGEQACVALLVMALQSIGTMAIGLSGWQIPIQTDSAFTKARIRHVGQSKIRQYLSKGYVVVTAGFQGVDPEGKITTLGRGGSDTSAVAIAAALRAEECFIFTDVDGVYTTDPRIVPEARRLDRITFEEMLEMASLGAKVLQIRSVELAGRHRVKTRVLSSFSDPDLPCALEAASGTLITFEEDAKMEDVIISGISGMRDAAKFTLVGVPDVTGTASKILGAVAAAQIEVDIIVQSPSIAGLTDFSFTVQREEYAKTLVIVSDICQQIGAQKVVGDPKVAKVSVVGIGMRSHSGVASQMFQALAQEGINIQMIATSEIKISVVIEDKYMELALRALHQAFRLSAREDQALDG